MSETVYGSVSLGEYQRAIGVLEDRIRELERRVGSLEAERRTVAVATREVLPGVDAQGRVSTEPNVMTPDLDAIQGTR